MSDGRTNSRTTCGERAMVLMPIGARTWSSQSTRSDVSAKHMYIGQSERQPKCRGRSVVHSGIKVSEMRARTPDFGHWTEAWSSASVERLGCGRDVQRRSATSSFSSARKWSSVAVLLTNDTTRDLAVHVAVLRGVADSLSYCMTRTQCSQEGSIHIRPQSYRPRMFKVHLLTV